MRGPHEPGSTVPEAVVAAAKSAFRFRVGEPDLAALAFDSLVDGTDPSADHLLRFEHPELTVEVSVRASRHGAVLSGRTRPASTPARTVLTVGADPEVKAEIHEDGFELGRVGHGLLRLVFDRPDGAFIATDWFRV